MHSVTLNLREVDSIQAAADKIGSLVDHLDVLINNAGISHSARDAVVTPNGTRTDLQFFNNHLGPFLLTSLLLPRLVAAGEKSPPGATRVINLTSNGHRLSPVRFSDYAFDRGIYDGVPEPERPGANLPAFLTKTNDGFPGFMGYGQSKSANVLHATEISRRLKRAGRGNVVGFAVHPGSIMTDLSRTLDPDSADAVTKTAPAHLWKTHDAGAATSVCAAFDPKLGHADLGGSVLGYMADCQLQDDLVAPHAADADIAKRLWDESEKMLQITTGF
ncbi:uncharacterized protein E0L32_000246 [Thyridium curvatum]|uniref:Uncharacterized protein n=1 Tax=Thyridium curvatum TaxID=1093900 RepID=A0A507B0X4_9PEZI|nr:uncharacterized protein E0L32_000246 [Thyridium curvatum]TPX15912.1 hypothetical protein E0L32_000246 [Thyridium curvatum]